MTVLTPQQHAAIVARGNILVAAGAGTGKTSTVTERCLDLVLRERCSIDRILMVTFTEAAAAEMRERLRKKLREAADSIAPDSDSALWLAEQLALLDTASISTLHSFCFELVLRNFHVLGLNPQLTVLDEGQTQPLIHTVLDELFLNHYASETTFSAAVRELIRAYGRGDDSSIRSLVMQLHRHAQTLARPEAWFARQIELFSNETPETWRNQFVLAVADWAQLWLDTLADLTQTATNIAASHQALTQLPLREPTFDKAANVVAEVVAADDNEWPKGKKTALRKPIEAFFQGARYLHDLALNHGSALGEDWKWSREQMVTLLRLAQEFGTTFAALKRELGGVDFADQEQFALRLLLDPDGLPSEVAKACRDKFQFVFVDECQDINAAQDAIICAISREGANANRFLVGDVKQSIYRFRLADPRIFQGYETNWKSPTNANVAGSVLPLTENFRCAEGLLHFINPVFRSLMRPVIGGLAYDANTELQFGDPKARNALAATNDPTPRVTLHVITKEDEASFASEETSETETKPTEIPDLQSTEREARLIALQLKQLKESRHPIWNRELKEGGFRPVEYSDMVVLLRGIAGRAEIFAKEFHKAGVPLHASRSGFLTAIEVSDVLNLLRLLDNPLQDLPLLAVLRSPLVGLSANELAEIRIAERRGLIWTALLKLSRLKSPLSAELVGKISGFIEQYQRWRDLTRHSSLTHCIETALNETCYESLLLAGERGEERVANVRRLIEMARRFDPFQREGLYRFLQFIGEQEAAEVDHEPAEAASVNAVRLMTIHASKGLEFPVVVLAGMGTRFNLRDLSSDVLLDEELGLCPKVFPPNTRSKYPSIAHWSAAQRERRALLGEEVRLLYVAMTRARDTLLLVGTAAKQDEVDRWQAATPITNHTLLKAGNYLDWLRLWFRNATTTVNWTSATEGQNQLLTWKFWTANDPSFASLENSHSDRPQVSLPTADQLSDIQTVLAARYEFEPAVAQPAKTTVTALRRRVADEGDNEARRVFQESAPLVYRKPSSKLTAAEIGTAHHAFLQFVALNRTATELDLRNEATQLERMGTLLPAQVEALDFAALTAFWQSDLGTAIRDLPERAVNREMPFTARFRVPEVEYLLRSNTVGDHLGLKADSDFVVVQGIADLAVLLPQEIWLVDFKTDHVVAHDLAAKVEHYKPQLKIYAVALARIFGRPVTGCWLHFLSAQKTVPIEPLA